MNDESAAVSLDSALATLRDFATANGLTGDQLLSVVAGARIAGEALGLVLRVPVMTLRTVQDGEDFLDVTEITDRVPVRILRPKVV